VAVTVVLPRHLRATGDAAGKFILNDFNRVARLALNRAPVVLHGFKRSGFLLLGERGLHRKKQAAGLLKNRRRAGILRRRAPEHRFERVRRRGVVAGAGEREGLAIPAAGKVGLRGDGLVETHESGGSVAHAREHGGEAVERPRIGRLQL
jgi:hypothetical protein